MCERKNPTEKTEGKNGVDNYGQDAGLRSKSSFKQNTRRARRRRYLFHLNETTWQRLIQRNMDGSSVASRWEYKSGEDDNDAMVS